MMCVDHVAARVCVCVCVCACVRVCVCVCVCVRYHGTKTRANNCIGPKQKTPPTMSVVASSSPSSTTPPPSVGDGGSPSSAPPKGSVDDGLLLDVSVVTDGVVLLELSSNKGVFKLNMFDVVAKTHSTFLSVARGETGVSSVVAEHYVTLVKLLEFAANSNGFNITQYKSVVKVVTALVAYIKAVKPELIVVEGEGDAGVSETETKEG